MSKITKKEYNSRKAELEAELKQVQYKISVLVKWNDTLDYNNLAEQVRQKLNKIGDYWNNLNDKEFELEQELQFLEDRWDRRNWTGSDWNSWELVTSNID
jgi:DNA repair exonuclease SbcCD ATPase subunit